jgi:hypothetical protein
LRLQRRPGDDVRAIWFLALLVLGFGSYFIEARFEAAISGVQENTESLYRRMVANERIVQRSKILIRVQNAAVDDLRRVSHETSLSATTAELVLELDASAKRYGTQIIGVEPNGVLPGPAGVTQHANDGLSATPFTIRAHGKFRGLLQLIEDLSHHRTLISVSDTQLELASGEAEQTQPKLDATIHATLFRLHMSPELEETVAFHR